MADISDIAIGIACVAFLFTQVHLWKVAKRLIRKSDASWIRVEGFVTEKYADLESKVKAQIQTELRGSQVGIETKIQDVTVKIESIRADLKADMEDLEEIDFEPIKQDLNGIEARLQGSLAATVIEIKDAVKTQMLHEVGLERRRLQKALEPFQDGIDDAGRAIVQEMQGNYDFVTIQLAKIMATELSEEYKEQNPGAAILIESGKLGLAEMMKRRATVGKESSSKKDVKSNTPSPFD